jgi:hypothetical protein
VIAAPRVGRSDRIASCLLRRRRGERVAALPIVPRAADRTSGRRRSGRAALRPSAAPDSRSRPSAGAISATRRPNHELIARRRDAVARGRQANAVAATVAGRTVLGQGVYPVTASLSRDSTGAASIVGISRPQSRTIPARPPLRSRGDPSTTPIVEVRRRPTASAPCLASGGGSLDPGVRGRGPSMCGRCSSMVNPRLHPAPGARRREAGQTSTSRR